MSWDRVLPAPAGLHYDSTQVRPSDLLDHKIMTDSRKAHDQFFLPETVKYADLRSNVPQVHQHLPPYSQPKIISSLRPGPVDYRDIKPQGPVITTKDISRSSSSSGSGSSSPTKSVKERDSFCLCQPDPKVPRPRNAFILYRQHYQAQVVAHNPGMANPDISKIIGGQWRSLSDEEKAKWRNLAEEEKIRHNQQYPGYRYQPRRSGRDGGPRSAGSGINNNPSGGTHCTRCGGRFMHPPSPVAPFTPSVSPEYRSPKFSGASQPKPRMMSASSACALEVDADEPKLFDARAVRDGTLYQDRSRPRPAEEIGGRSPNMKRRRVSGGTIKPPPLPINRDRSPEPTYQHPHPHSPYGARHDITRTMLPIVHTQRQNGPPKGKPHPDPSLKLPPLQAMTPVVSPIISLPPPDSSVEATVMTIPFLNKIKVLAKISPPLTPSFHTTPQARGPVIAIEGQDPELVQIAVNYLEKLLKKAATYHVRIFEGPTLRKIRDIDRDSYGQADTTAEYLNKISAWHTVSEKVINFVKVAKGPTPTESHSSPEADAKAAASLSPNSLVDPTGALSIRFGTPPQSSDCGSETDAAPDTVPVALVPRYQLTTADTFACSTPIHDSYNPLDHWQWMASLWRTCVGPDITVYIRECSREELASVGGNPVEIRLQDVRTIILRKVAGTGKDLEEKSLKRVGFEIEDFLTQ